MLSFKIWDKISPINNIEASYIIESHKVKDDDEVFLILKGRLVTQINVVSNIKDIHGFDENLTAEQTAQAFLDYLNSEESQIREAQENIYKYYNKVNSLSELNANLILDNALKIIEINKLNKTLAGTVLEIANLKVGV